MVAHELLRPYADEKLEGSGEDAAAHDGHSAYYAVALQQWGEDLKGPHQQMALAEMDAEIENARAAWDWTVRRGQVESLDRAMEGLCRSYERRGRYQEAEAACGMAAERLSSSATGPGARVRTRALTWQGVFGRLMGHTETARQLFEQSLALSERPELGDQDTRQEEACVLLQMERVFEGSNRGAGGELDERSLALYRAMGAQWGAANALQRLGYVYRLLGSYEVARQLCEESLAIRRALGDQSGIADSLLELGWAAILQARFEKANA